MATTGGQSPAQSSIQDPKTPPVQLLQTTNSFVYNHIHAALVLGIFYANFSRTVSDPVTSLIYLTIPLAILQATFVCTCVPASSDARTIPAQSAAGAKAAQPQRRKQKPITWQATLQSRLIPAIISVILSTTITVPPLFVLAVLHGAPITTHIPHTLLLATHLSLLSCVPLFYAHGVSSSRWRTLYSLQAPIDELMGAAIGTIVGAWLGAIPIPLDWDREWQKWPVTIVVGAYGGWAVGRTLGGLPWLKGKHVRFD